MALPPHTDTTYFTHPVGLQFFHLLRHDGQGGEQSYVDGFRVALQLKEQAPWAFDLLTTLRVKAHSAGDDGTLIQSCAPMIQTDPETGELVQIRFNNDDRSTLDHLSASQVMDFYRALREWTRLTRDPQNVLWVKLKPGFAVIMDNWRVLHGRAAFTGHRHLCGSYHPHDDYRSRVKTLLYPLSKNDL
jgi:trimethyllysine dioxygenase